MLSYSNDYRAAYLKEARQAVKVVRTFIGSKACTRKNLDGTKLLQIFVATENFFGQTFEAFRRLQNERLAVESVFAREQRLQVFGQIRRRRPKFTGLVVENSELFRRHRRVVRISDLAQVGDLIDDKTDRPFARNEDIF